MLEPQSYKHFVFDDWTSIENNGKKYPWQILITEKQGKILEDHKEDALVKA